MQIKDVLMQARSKTVAVGAFNILNYITSRAVVETAEKYGTPVILQTSVSTVKHLGVHELGGMLTQLKELSSQPIIIHLDHCRDQELARQCLKHNWDAVMIDGSHLPMQENIRFTREIVEYAHHLGKQVEGELGVIAGVEDGISNEEGTGVTLEECLVYIKETGVDVFAPSIGTAHGVYRGIPKLRFDLVQELTKVSDTPIVVHGGSGLPTEDFQKLIACGASKINISTAIKQSYLKSLREYDKLENPLEVDSYVLEAIKATVKEHMDIFLMK